MTAIQAAEAPAGMQTAPTSKVGRHLRSTLSELALFALLIGMSPAALVVLWATREVPAHEGDE
jgi:hypothetical protein